MTSSTSSRRTPTFAEHEAPLRAALVEVAERSFFAFVSEADDELLREAIELAAETAGAPPPWLTTRVAFSGAFAGEVVVDVPVALADSLLRGFLGHDQEEPVAEGDVSDAAGEFANMLCGTWLTRACQRRRFDLQPPRSERRPEGWRPDPAPPRAYGGYIVAMVNDLPARITLHFDAGSS